MNGAEWLAKCQAQAQAVEAARLVQPPLVRGQERCRRHGSVTSDDCLKQSVRPLQDRAVGVGAACGRGEAAPGAGAKRKEGVQPPGCATARTREADPDPMRRIWVNAVDGPRPGAVDAQTWFSVLGAA